MINFMGKRKLAGWGGEASSASTPIQSEVIKDLVQEKSKDTEGQSGPTETTPVDVVVQNKGQIIKSGNGHKSKIKRKLFDSERVLIRSGFVAINGETTEDHWKSFHSQTLDSIVAIFQVTGFVSYLHREIACGKFQVPNMPSYMDWLSGQIKLWAQYNSSKYQTYRNILKLHQKKQQEQSVSQGTADVFANTFGGSAIK